MTDETTVLVVDDQPQNVRLLDAVLSPRGYRVLSASSGEEALDLLRAEQPHLVLLDILMPGMDGYEVCRRIRENPDTAFLPVVMVTASEAQQKVRAIEAGADDFITKPFDQAELLARVKSLVRVKRYQDTIRSQAEELEAWNRQLEARAESQVAELERATRLRRFLPPQMAEMVLDSGDESFLESHRREIVVVFCDLREFTPFAESSEPEEIMAVLAEYHAALGDLVFRFEGTLERFTGDGLMVVFNDPIPCEDGPSSDPHGCIDADQECAISLLPGHVTDTISPSASASRRIRHSGPNRVRGPLRLHRDRQRRQSRRSTVLSGAAVADPRHPAGAHQWRNSSSARRPAIWNWPASASRCGRSM